MDVINYFFLPLIINANSADFFMADFAFSITNFSDSFSFLVCFFFLAIVKFLNCCFSLGKLAHLSTKGLFKKRFGRYTSAEQVDMHIPTYCFYRFQIQSSKQLQAIGKRTQQPQQELLLRAPEKLICHFSFWLFFEFMVQSIPKVCTDTLVNKYTKYPFMYKGAYL